MASARGGNDLIKTRREYIQGSGAASLLLTVLSGHSPPLTNAL